jgi:uncharacterized membrane protein
MALHFFFFLNTALQPKTGCCISQATLIGKAIWHRGLAIGLSQLALAQILLIFQYINLYLQNKDNEN